MSLPLDDDACSWIYLEANKKEHIYYLSVISYKLRYPRAVAPFFLQSSSRACIFIKSYIGLYSSSRIVAINFASKSKEKGAVSMRGN